MIYFLLRQRVDELPMTYVYEERVEEDAAAPGGADKAPEERAEGASKL
jgi:hypothetical protein